MKIIKMSQTWALLVLFLSVTQKEGVGDSLEWTFLLAPSAHRSDSIISAGWWRSLEFVKTFVIQHLVFTMFSISLNFRSEAFIVK